MTSTPLLAETATRRRSITRTNQATAAAQPQASVRDLLHRAGQLADDDFVKRVKASDLTPRQWCVLDTLSHQDGVSQTALVDRTGVDRSTMADLVKRLQRKGLLQRRRTREDARAYSVRLTDDGRRVLRLSASLSRESDAAVLGVLSHPEQKQFLGLLARVAKGASHG